jgi:hypothetical protein
MWPDCRSSRRSHFGGSGTYYQTFTDAARAMIHIEKIVPTPELVDRYNSGYENFLKELRERNYIEPNFSTK